MREIRTPVQMPDWNMWLPDTAPEDLWANRNDYQRPNQIYQSTLSKLRAKPVQTLASEAGIQNIFGSFTRDLENWLGGYRVASVPIDTPTLKRRVSGLSREDVLQSISRWRAVKMVGLVREFNLEGVHDSERVWRTNGRPKYTNELLSLPGITPRANVWQMAPHIISGNTLNFENQWKSTGSLESNQWYILQLIVNGGNRVPAPGNVGVDWNYLFGHFRSAYYHTGGLYSVMNFVTKMKQLQLRDTGKGVHNDGFSAASMQPAKFFSETDGDPNFVRDSLDRASSGLWRIAFEEYLHEWLDVVESINVNNATLMPRQTNENYFEPKTTVPVPWNGRDDYFEKVDRAITISQFYRLLPKMVEADLDPLLIEDFARCCQRIWPYNASRWGSVPSWSASYQRAALLSENFETGSRFGGVSQVRIKDNSGVNTSTLPKNGGGTFVASTTIANNATQKQLTASVNTAIPANTPRLTVRLRTAFVPGNLGSSRDLDFEIGLKFNNRTGFDYSPADQLSKGLFNSKFQSYEGEIAVPGGSARVVQVLLRWKKPQSASGGAIYLDNFSLTPMKAETLARDTTAPSAPRLSYNNGLLSTSQRLPKIRLSWNRPSASDLVGYSLYRWTLGDPPATKIRVQDRLIKEPYRSINDGSARPGISYRYQVTAVDQAGNESGPSNIVTVRLPDPEIAKPPQAWLSVESEGVLIGAIGAHEPDVSHYRYYRKAEGEANFTLLSNSQNGTEGAVFLDRSARRGANYLYYLEAVDRNGNTLRSGEISLGSPSTGSTALLGESAPQARYTPLQHFSALSSRSIEQSAGFVTQWRNLVRNELHAEAIRAGLTYPSTSRTSSGDAGIDLKPDRQGLAVLTSAAQNALLDFSTAGAARGKNGFAVLIACKLDKLSTTSRNPILVNHGNPAVQESFGLRLSNVGELQLFAGGRLINKGGVRYRSGDTIVLAFNYNASTGAYQWWDVKSGTTTTGTLSTGVDFSSVQTMYLGTSLNDGQFLDGTINEVLVYDRLLTNAQRTSLQDELSTRWTTSKPPLLGTHEAEYYDLGPNTEAYYDTTSANIPGAYRPDQAVDVQNCQEGGYNVSHTVDSEYLKYTVMVPENGLYDLHFRLASASSDQKTLKISCNDEAVGRELKLNTGGAGWQDWSDYVLRAVPLAAGTQTLKVTFETGGLNFNAFRVTRSESSTGQWDAVLSYQEWQKKWLGHVGAPADDDDRDGKTNLVEYALGGNPLSAGEAALAGEPQYEFTPTGIRVKHKMLKGDARLKCAVELSETLQIGDWVEAASPTYLEDPNDLLYDEVQYTLPKGRKRYFMRVSVDLE